LQGMGIVIILRTYNMCMMMEIDVNWNYSSWRCVYVNKLHMGSLKLQAIEWKSYNLNLSTWAFYKVNDNQVVNLEMNQQMRCIICHSQMSNLKILTLHRKLCKGFIKYHKSNAIIFTKNI
jgi:hypothetical protein